MPHYLDHAATSPIRPGVLTGYTKALELIGNPASVHSYGQRARALLEESREQIASVIGCDRNEVIFTSGGTESNNLAIKGLFWNRNQGGSSRPLIVTAPTEHHAVLEPIGWLVATQGAQVHYLPVNASGEINPKDLEDFLNLYGDQVALVSLMWANNEIGVINPILEIAEIASRYSIPVHSDAIAAYSHVPISFRDSKVSALSITAHKIGGPVGIGALILSRTTNLVSLQQGGSHERGIRSGTPDAAAAAAFAQSVQEAGIELADLSIRHRALIDQLVAGVKLISPEVIVSGESASRLPNVVHLRFPHALGETLMFLLDQSGVAVSTGAACSAGVSEPSHVVLAMGVSEQEAASGIRVSLGHSSTQEDIDAFLASLPECLAKAQLAGLVNRK